LNGGPEAATAPDCELALDPSCAATVDAKKATQIAKQAGFI
jgi:hypothetical protein